MYNRRVDFASQGYVDLSITFVNFRPDNQVKSYQYLSFGDCVGTQAYLTPDNRFISSQNLSSSS